MRANHFDLIRDSMSTESGKREGGRERSEGEVVRKNRKRQRERKAKMRSLKSVRKGENVSGIRTEGVYVRVR